MKFPGFVGPTYNLPSVNVDCQRCVNLIPEVIESGSGKEGATVYFKNTPGLRKLFEVGTGPIRMIQVDDPKPDPENPPNRIFVCSGSEMYKVTYDGATWVPTKLGDMLTSTGPVTAISTRTNLGRTIFADGKAAYIFWRFYSDVDPEAPPTEVFLTWNPAEDESAPTPTHVVWIDGFTIFNKKDDDQFWVSNYATITFDLLNFAYAEGNPDVIMGMIANNRDLYLFGERTLEIWSNTGNSSFPFERMPGGFVEKGCAARYSIAKIDGINFWLGRDESGQGVVYAMGGTAPQRISTHAVESAFRRYANVSTARAFTYQQDGHSYYVLNFDEATWVYDLSTKMWHERESMIGGEITRHRADCIGFFPTQNLHLVGDFETNAVYALDPLYRYDDTTEIQKYRISPHASAGGKRVFYKEFLLDMETGIGLDGDVQGSDPQVMLQWSNDGGHTWSSEDWTSAGKKIGGIGDFKKRVVWRRLGSARDRVFKVLISDPVSVNIIGAEIEMEVGNN